MTRQHISQRDRGGMARCLGEEPALNDSKYSSVLQGKEEWRTSDTYCSRAWFIAHIATSDMLHTGACLTSCRYCSVRRTRVILPRLIAILQASCQFLLIINIISFVAQTKLKAKGDVVNAC